MNFEAVNFQAIKEHLPFFCICFYIQRIQESLSSSDGFVKCFCCVVVFSDLYFVVVSRLVIQNCYLSD